MRRNLLSLLCLIALAGTTACTTMRTVPAGDEAAIAGHVEPGDRIRLTTRSGVQDTYRVIRLENEALVVEPRRGRRSAAEERIAYGDIATIEVERLDKWRTGALVIGVVGTVAIVGALSNVTPGFPAPPQ